MLKKIKLSVTTLRIIEHVFKLRLFYQNDISEFCSLVRNYCLLFPLHIPQLVLQQLAKTRQLMGKNKMCIGQLIENRKEGLGTKCSEKVYYLSRLN
jgi:hypothetical protein